MSRTSRGTVGGVGTARAEGRVRPGPPRPTGVEREFGREEIIVSKTDPKGRITYANDVFCSVAAYAEAELLGQPHSVVRHPDMPMSVFELMWETISAGREMFAYVVNLASDGGHYWVLAHITPSFGPSGDTIGYHSNRRWVAPAVRAEVAGIYRSVRAAEERPGSKKERIAAGRAALAALLEARGTGYDELVWSVAAEDARS